MLQNFTTYKNKNIFKHILIPTSRSSNQLFLIFRFGRTRNYSFECDMLMQILDGQVFFFFCNLCMTHIHVTSICACEDMCSLPAARSCKGILLFMQWLCRCIHASAILAHYTSLNWNPYEGI